MYEFLAGRAAPLSAVSLDSTSGRFENGENDPLIYISSVKKYPLSLALRMTLDLGSAAAWNEIFAMSVLSILPPVLLFFAGQKYFIQGISTSGLKG